MSIQSEIARITSEVGTQEDLIAQIMAVVEGKAGASGGGIDVSFFEGMKFEEGMFTPSSDTAIFDYYVETSFAQCYGGIVYAANPDEVASGRFIYGLYLAFPSATYKRRCVICYGSASFAGSNNGVLGNDYYKSNIIFINYTNTRINYESGKTYSWIAWGK